MSVQECWVIAKEKCLCFNVLQVIIWERIVQGQRYAQYRDAKEAITIYYTRTLKKRSEVATGGGNQPNFISRDEFVPTAESLSLCTIPVCLKANGKKVKVNAIVDDTSTECFFND